MRNHVRAASLAVLLSALAPCLASAFGKDLLDLCGAYVGRGQREMFLHRRQVVEQERARLTRSAQGEVAPTAATALNQDAGQIALLDDSAGVVARRNPFNLDRRTLIFTPAQSGYQTTLGDDTFDAAASQSGTKLDGLGDDDTRAVTLPFGFRFFGTNYNQAWVNSNGTLTFTTGDVDANAFYGHFVAGPPVIAACFTDLDPSVPTAAVRVLAEKTRVVITWALVPLASSPSFGVPRIENFQIRLYPTGAIEIAYRSTNPPDAIVGITAGNLQPVTLGDFASGVSAAPAGGLAEIFSATDAVDIVYAAQRFYQTHDDAYDYLVFYNAVNVAADSGVVAYELTARSNAEGYGDAPTEIGADFGSRRRLRAVMNMGPLSQYPTNPSGLVFSRSPIGDTPLTLLTHEAGHLFLAFVSVPDPAIAGSHPMLGKALAHWAFPFNSEASVMEGNRIVDRGSTASPRFATTATVEGYSPLDQYLMGFREPQDVPPTFVVLNSGQAATRSPQVGVQFGGSRLDVTANDIAALYGRRTPDSTVAQRQFRFGFVLILPAGADPSSRGPWAAQIAQVDRYRTEFEAFYAKASSGRGSADTGLRSAVTLSMAPATGVVLNSEATASLELTRPAGAPITFTLHKPNNVLLSPASLTIPAGASHASFSVFGGREGVEEFTAEPSDAAYETASARVQVSAVSALHLALANPAAGVSALRIEDPNRLPYGGVRVNALVLGGSPLDSPLVTSGPSGRVLFNWNGTGALLAALEGVTGGPAITPGGVVQGASFGPRLGTGAFVTIFGQHLSGAQLRINGALAPTSFVADTQVNFLSPANLPPGPAEISLETPLGLAIVRAAFNAYAPGIFSSSIQINGRTISFYATGAMAPADALRVQVDGANVAATLANPTAGGRLGALFDGIQKLAAALPQLPPGTHTLSLSVNGIVSNTVTFEVALGN